MADAAQLYEKAIKFTERQLNLLREEISQKESRKSNHGGQNGSIPDVDDIKKELKRLDDVENRLETAEQLTETHVIELYSRLSGKVDSERIDNMPITRELTESESGEYKTVINLGEIHWFSGEDSTLHFVTTHSTAPAQLNFRATDTSGLVFDFIATKIEDSILEVNESASAYIRNLVYNNNVTITELRGISGVCLYSGLTLEHNLDMRILDAPSNGNKYVRQNGVWVETNDAIITAFRYSEVTNPSESSLYKFTATTPPAYGNPINKTCVLWRPVIESGITKWVPCQPLIYSDSPTFNKTMIPSGIWGPFITCLASQTLIEYISIDSFVSNRYTETIASTKTSTTL